MFANVVFHKKLPHRGDEEGSPIRSTRVILPTFLTRKKKKKTTLRSCKQWEVENNAYCWTCPKSQNCHGQVLNLCEIRQTLGKLYKAGCFISIENNVWRSETENTNIWWTWILHVYTTSGSDLYKSETTKSPIRCHRIVQSLKTSNWRWEPLSILSSHGGTIYNIV